MKKFIFSKFGGLQDYSQQLYYQMNSFTDIFDSILSSPMLTPCFDLRLSPPHQILQKLMGGLSLKSKQGGSMGEFKMLSKIPVKDMRSAQSSPAPPPPLISINGGGTAYPNVRNTCCRKP